jgi:putative acetyltransferase
MWTIRPEAAEDVAAIREVHLGAFAPGRTEADPVEALRASDAHASELCLVALVREGLRRAAQTQLGLVVVLGHAAYYPRFGFEPAGDLGIEAPFPVPAEAWMAHRLPAYRAEMRGTVMYPPAFAEG